MSKSEKRKRPEESALKKKDKSHKKADKKAGKKADKKVDKLSKKRKRQEDNADIAGDGDDASTTAPPEAVADAETGSGAADDVGKREKKRRKKDKIKASNADGLEPTDGAATSEQTGGDDKKSSSALPSQEQEREQQIDEEKLQEQQQGEGKNTRFICFIGNLPYTATENAVRAHFSSLSPTDVRVLTEKNTPKRSRGMAFIEFDRYDHMRTCLDRFHHSEFNDNVSPARKINVELTAGGGGKKSKARKEKIKEKNKKLNERRARHAQAEKSSKKEKKKEEVKPDTEGDGVHPSRRGLVQF